jgi:hypothetical protein
MDIATDMTAFCCFPLSTKNRISVGLNPLYKIEEKLLLERYEFWKTIYLKKCRKCSFYGYKKQGKCPGPCIAFILNRDY